MTLFYRKDKPLKTSRGLSLVELAVGSVLIVLVFFGMVHMFKNIVLVSAQTRHRLDASTLTKEIAEDLKTIPFDDLYSLDSANKNPPKEVNLSAQYPLYLLKWSESGSLPRFNAIEIEVDRRGFSRFTVDVTYMILS